jgi:putative FmdB family regulatory protein
MPLYEYACQTCSDSFEKLISASRADEQQVCPKCGGHETSRQLSSFAVSNGSSAGSMMSAPPASSPFT